MTDNTKKGLVDRIIPRNVAKLAVGQVYYTGWCDDEGKLLDDGTVTRLGERSFRLTSAEPSLRWLHMNAVGMDVTVTERTDQMAALSLQGPKSRAVLFSGGVLLSWYGRQTAASRTRSWPWAAMACCSLA